jgi:hypothetical protein
MPPKKKQEEEIDINTLPPWQALICSLNFETKKSRADKFLQRLHTQFSFQKNISRNDIINFAKDKGMYTDPATLTDKQKKDPKFMADIQMELTPAIMGKAFYQLIWDLNLHGRKVEDKNSIPFIMIIASLMLKFPYHF